MANKKCNMNTVCEFYSAMLSDERFASALSSSEIDLFNIMKDGGSYDDVSKGIGISKARAQQIAKDLKWKIEFAKKVLS